MSERRRTEGTRGENVGEGKTIKKGMEEKREMEEIRERGKWETKGRNAKGKIRSEAGRKKVRKEGRRE